MITVLDMVKYPHFNSFTTYRDLGAAMNVAKELISQRYEWCILPCNDGYDILVKGKTDWNYNITRILKNNPDVRVVGEKERMKRERALEQMNRLY